MDIDPNESLPASGAAPIMAGFREIEQVLCDELKKHYGDRLVSAVVFGSVGRGTPRHDSDVDVLIVGEPLPNGRMARVRDFGAVETELETTLAALARSGIETRLSPVFKTRAECERGSALFLDMVDDARILFDRDGFFAARLARLRTRLTELGAIRHWQGSSWYWDLKPDFRPGDEIEL